MSSSRRLAAIDIGTVTTRLLVADVDGDGVSEVLRSTDITHLGEGLSETGSLSDAAMGRVEAVIEGYAVEMSRLGVESYRAVATSASRDAANGDMFARMLVRHGIDIEIVPGEVEATLAFAGATYGFTGSGLLVNDIGGGSTELVFGDASDGSPYPRVQFVRSIDVGSRRVTDGHLASDPPTGGELAGARQWVLGRLEPYFAALPGTPRTSIALAGTATTLSAIHQGLAEYDPARVHGSVLGRADVEDLLEMLAALPLAERREVTGLHPGRAGVIVAGALVLDCVLELAGLDSTIVSEHDILYGIVLDVYTGLESAGGRE